MNFEFHIFVFVLLISQNHSFLHNSVGNYRSQNEQKIIEKSTLHGMFNQYQKALGDIECFCLGKRKITILHK